VLDNAALDAALSGFGPVPRRPWETALNAVLDERLGPLPGPLAETDR
jgi:hypothetical protein